LRVRSMDLSVTASGASTQHESLNFSSFTSTIGSKASTPSPEGDTTLRRKQVGEGVKSGMSKGALKENAIPPYGTLGHLSYAPATQTTVVTTTTTTTTSFPPLFLNPPTQLDRRDPKLYPLAFSPTPDALKRFCFDIDGKRTCFHEADDVEISLKEVCVMLLDWMKASMGRCIRY
jgi:hypothetical protein